MKTLAMIILLGALFSYQFTLPAQAAGPKPYTVINGNLLDAETYQGFKLYRNWCARCHGTYAQGLAGPNLTESLNRITYEEFMKIVAEGKTGQIGVMPGWRANLTVMQGRANIYRYLKARADGAIGLVKPGKIK